jgi:hypothetical protein
LSLILLEYCNINTDPIQKKRGAITRKPKTWCFTTQNTLNHHCAQPPQQKALCFTFFSLLPSPHLQNLAIHIFFFSSLLPKDTLISSPPTDHAADKTQPATAPSPVPHGSLSPSLSNTSNPETTLNIHHCQQASTFVFWPTFIIFSTVGSSGCIPQPLQQLQP